MEHQDSQVSGGTWVLQEPLVVQEMMDNQERSEDQDQKVRWVSTAVEALRGLQDLRGTKGRPDPKDCPLLWRCTETLETLETLGPQV